MVETKIRASRAVPLPVRPREARHGRDGAPRERIVFLLARMSRVAAWVRDGGIHVNMNDGSGGGGGGCTTTILISLISQIISYNK